MISSEILRETENASSTRKIQKPVTLEKNRLKAKALGDVQNTLHSRPGNLLSTNTPAKFPSKSTNVPKSAPNKYTLLAKNIMEKKINTTPIKSETMSLLSTPDIDDYAKLAHHSHGLCEHGDSFVKNFLTTYKLSEEQVQDIVYGVKNYQRPVSVPVWEPCEDIELFDIKVPSEKNFSVSDILCDVILPEIPPP